MNTLSDELLVKVLAKSADTHDQSGATSVDASVFGDDDEMLLGEPDDGLLDDGDEEKEDILSFLNGINEELAMGVKQDPSEVGDTPNVSPEPEPEPDKTVQQIGKFDLRQMASSGQAGRIMFVFEKTAESELL